MDQIYGRVAGLDVHRDNVVACVRTPMVFSCAPGLLVVAELMQEELKVIMGPSCPKTEDEATRLLCQHSVPRATSKSSVTDYTSGSSPPSAAR
jgi:hypothetical protein